MIEQLFPGGGGGGGTVDTVQAGTGISVDATDPANPIVSSTVTDTNDAAKVSSNDTTAGYLNGKLVAGSNITFTEGNDGGNETLTIAAAGGVTGFTGSQNTASPNNTVNASRLLVSATSTNADAVLQPKGTGALLANLPDSGVSGGNKRSTWCVDFQTAREVADQVASGLYSTIAGGISNKATGQYSGVAYGYKNISSGNYSSAAGGESNTASGAHSGILSGKTNTSSGNYSIVTGGINNTASGLYSGVFGGNQNTATGQYSFAYGFDSDATQYGAIAVGTRALSDKFAMRSFAGASFTTTAGNLQEERYILLRETTNATPAILSCNGDAPGATTRIGISSDATYTFRALVTARRTDADNESAGWEVKGVIDNNAGTTALVGSVTVTSIGDDSAGTWTLAVTADNTNDALQFEVTGEANKTIRWAATVELIKVTG